MPEQSTQLTRQWEGLEIPTAGTFALDPVHSQVGFVSRHMMVSKVRGRFDTYEGTIVIADDPLNSSVDVNIDVSSVDTGNEQRDEHLRSSDFFEQEQNPKIEFKSSGLRHVGGEDFVLSGELVVHGVSRPVELTFEFSGVANDPWGNQRLGFSARTEVDREDFGLTWNQALETGGFLIGKKATIEIEGEAVRQG
jgi:polyisoprenoid-binding protein YceI